MRPFLLLLRLRPEQFKLMIILIFNWITHFSNDGIIYFNI